MDPTEVRQNSDESQYCPDRRTALSALALAAGGLMLGAAFPQRAEAKGARVSRYAIIYKLNGGKRSAKQVKYIKRGSTIEVSQIGRPTRKGYRFSAWYTNDALTKKATVVRGKANRKLRTVYAKWRPERYSITYKLNGGKASGRHPSSYTIESEKILFGTPKRRGYAFKGWYKDSGFSKKKSSIKAGSTGDVTVYARWERIKYSITYDLGGGKASVALPKSYTVKSSTIRPIPPVKRRYRFDGWYSDSEFRKKVKSIPAGSVGNVKLYAKWASTEYWNDHLDTKCARINRIAGRMANPIPSLVFITDMHLPTNAMVSPELVRRVVSRTDTNMVVFGGDAINRPVTRTEAVRMLRYVRNAFGKAEVHMVRGNHDGNGQGYVSPEEKIDERAFVEICQHESEVRQNGEVYCYRDDVGRKVRYIFLDSGEPNAHCMGMEQVQWLKDRVLELEEGWTVLVFVHQFYSRLVKGASSTYAVFDSNGKLIKAALDSIHGQAKAEIAGVISGHCHRDYAEYSDKGYPMISTTCDAYGRGKPDLDFSYKLGTLAEQVFDVVSLDTGRRKLYLTRIGKGKNRTFTYAPPAREPAEEETQPVTEQPADEVPAEGNGQPTDDAPTEGNGQPTDDAPTEGDDQTTSGAPAEDGGQEEPMPLQASSL